MNLRAKIFRVLTILALVAGIACLSYPLVSNLIIQAAQAQVAKLNVVAAENLDADKLDHEWQAAYEYNAALKSSLAVVTDPFNPNVSISALDDYDDILNLNGDGVMGSVEIPEIKAYVPIYHGTSDEVLAKGAGHLSMTSLPVGGESTHCVMAGHTGLPTVKIFDNLEKLHEGSVVVLNVLDERLYYKVYSIEVVEPECTSSLAVVQGRDLLTLVTCTPYGVNSHRLLVHAERCAPEEGAEAVAAAEADQWPISPELIAILVAVLALVALTAFLVRRRFVRRRRQRLLAEAAYATSRRMRG